MKTIDEFCDENPDIELLKADGFDACIVGVAESFGGAHYLIYDRQKVIDTLVNEGGLTEEEAWEHFSYNIAGAYVGESTPAYLLEFLRP